MIQAVADTHAVIWYLFDDERLSGKARKAIEKAASVGDEIGFSAITLVEMVYLVEKGKINADAFARFMAAIEAADSVWVEIPVTGEIANDCKKFHVSLFPICQTASLPRLPNSIKFR